MDDDSSWNALMSGAAPLLSAGETPKWLARALEKITPTDFVVALEEPLDERRLASDLREIEQSSRAKPRGLWFSCGREWLDFAWRNEMIEGARHVYTLTFDLREVLKIRTGRELVVFSEHFSTQRYPGDFVIDWVKVASIYEGIVICPWQSSSRDHHGLEWYHPWDVASGCVWNAHALLGWKKIA